MQTSKYIFAAAALIVLVCLSYFLHFYIDLRYEIAGDPAVWGQLGDYVGGVLNPLLSFVSIVLLIKSLSLQNEANMSLRAELRNSEKTEKLRSFEVLFFNLINSQKGLFDSFRVERTIEGILTQSTGAEAVMDMEDDIAALRGDGGTDQDVGSYLDEMDRKDQLFGLVRAFYLIVKMIEEKLSDGEGFSQEERRAHLTSLVNFTDFAQLRVVLLCVQFMEYESAKYLRSSTELEAVLDGLGLNRNLY